MKLNPLQNDRTAGVLVALAAGDALGAGYEFGAPLPDGTEVTMKGGGPFGFAPAEWTDDTSMAIPIAEALLEPACDGGASFPTALTKIVRAWTAWAAEAGLFSHYRAGTGRCLWPSDLNVGVVLLDPVGHPVAPQPDEHQRGFLNPDVLVLRDRDAGAREDRVLILIEEESDLPLRRHEILEVEELHKLLERAEEFEEVPIVSGDVGEGADWLLGVVAPDAFQCQVHPVRNRLSHSPGGVEGGQVYSPDGPDHGAADRVWRVEIAALLLLTQLGLSLDQGLGPPPRGVGIRDGVTAERDRFVGRLLEHQVVIPTHLGNFRDRQFEQLPLA